MAMVSDVKFGTFHEMISAVAAVLGVCEPRDPVPEWWEDFCLWFIPFRKSILKEESITVQVNKNCSKMVEWMEHHQNPLAFLKTLLDKIENDNLRPDWEWYKIAALDYARIVSEPNCRIEPWIASFSLRTEAFESGPFVETDLEEE
jgi:hypothetical protein